MEYDTSSASALFAEKHCDEPGCPQMVPEGVSLCHSCLIAARRRTHGSGNGRLPDGRFEARVRRVAMIARRLDHAESAYRSDQSAAKHRVMMRAFADYVQAVRLLTRQ